jgi:SAM-dependent methyltransferase
VTPAEYWRSNEKLQHITPPGVRFPEVKLFPALQSSVVGTVFEFGCGDGRLSPAFAADKYTGFDINPSALASARINNPEHRYCEDWQQADTFLAYTVLLHIPDEGICAVLNRAKQYRRIVIGEIMGRAWRRGGNPPVFNRALEEYAQMIGRKPSVMMIDYPRYSTQLTLAVFE